MLPSYLRDGGDSGEVSVETVRLLVKKILAGTYDEASEEVYLNKIIYSLLSA
jgi:hypothetical protein